MRRRRFLRAASALLAAPALARADTDRPVEIGAAWRGPTRDSLQRAGVLRVDWTRREVAIRWAAHLPTRAHGLLAEADGSLLVVAVRPGRWLARYDATGALVRRLLIDDEPGARRFSGHVAASADGHWLYTTESDPRTLAGLVSVRDRRALARVAQWRTGGVDPHQLLVDRDGALVLANGGVPRGRDDRKLDLSAMDSSLVRIDAASGSLLGQWRLDDPRLSLRHLAWSRAPAQTRPLLGIALQAEHDDPLQRAGAPLLALWDGVSLQVPASPTDGDGYAGDIAPAPRGGFVVSSNRVGRALWWRPDQPDRFTLVAQLRQAYALASDARVGDAESPAVLVAAARGVGRWHPGSAGAMLAWPEPMALDNHWVTMPA